MGEYRWINAADRLPEIRSGCNICDEEGSDLVLVSLKQGHVHDGAPLIKLAYYIEKGKARTQYWLIENWGYVRVSDGAVKKWLPIPEIEEETGEE